MSDFSRFRRNPVPSPTDLAHKTARTVIWLRCKGWFKCGGFSPQFLDEQEAVEWCRSKGWVRIGEGREAIDLCPECQAKEAESDDS